MTVEEYIANTPCAERLLELRKVILETVPGLTEYIGYGMPGYKYKARSFVYFAAFKNHIGFYALPDAHSEFDIKLSKYKRGKGSVQFPMDEPLPWELIKELLIYKKNKLDEKV